MITFKDNAVSGTMMLSNVTSESFFDAHSGGRNILIATRDEVQSWVTEQVVALCIDIAKQVGYKMHGPDIAILSATLYDYGQDLAALESMAPDKKLIAFFDY